MNGNQIFHAKRNTGTKEQPKWEFMGTVASSRSAGRGRRRAGPRGGGIQGRFAPRDACFSPPLPRTLPDACIAFAL